MEFLKRHILSAGAVAFVILLSAYLVLIAPPADFPKDAALEIQKGATLSEIVEQLQDARIIAHPKTFWMLARVQGLGGKLQAGRYVFPEPQNALTILYRLAEGRHGTSPIRITFPEGMSVREMSLLIASSSGTVTAQDFIAAGRAHEGYLFPDPYLFDPAATAEEVVGIMRKNFDKKIASLMPKIQASGRSIGEVVIMASLLEKEARTTVNRRIVSGVLWNRLARGMPLQVDAVFGYIFNRPTYSPSYDDLKVNSPYNTYMHAGLPPGPINNPGMDALIAALVPTTTEYFYYLTDREGVMRYARTYAEHLANENRYLR